MMSKDNKKLVTWDKLTIKEKNEVAEAVSTVLLESSTMFKCSAIIIGMSLSSLDMPKAIMSVIAGRRETLSDIAHHLMVHHALFRNLMLAEMDGNKNPLITKLEEVFGKYNVDVESAENFFAALRGVSERLVAKGLAVSDEECEQRIRADEFIQSFMKDLFGEGH